MARSDNLRDMLNKGMAASRDAVSKAASQAKSWSEMGVIKLEIAQLRSQAEKLNSQLGAEVYAAFEERKEMSLSPESPGIRETFSRLRSIRREIALQQAAYRKAGGKDSDLE